MHRQHGVPRAQSRGFTIFELLIVIAIIGIIASVLIPILLSARHTADRRILFGRDFNNLSAPLTTAQMTLLRPLAYHRISQACDQHRAPVEAESAPAMQTTDPTTIQDELDKMAGKVQTTPPECSRIRDAARREGYLSSPEAR